MAAIRIAPVTLARAGVLQGKQTTVFESPTGEVEAGGATCTGESVVRDGLVITANGPSVARQFSETIAAALEKSRVSVSGEDHGSSVSFVRPR